MGKVGILQIIVETVAALLEAVDLIETVCLLAGHAGIQNQTLAVACLCQFLGMVHQLDAVALAAFILVGDDAGDIAGGAGQPEGVEVSTVAETVILVAVHQEECKAVFISQNICINLTDDFLVIGVVGPELFNLVECYVEIFHGCVLKFHVAILPDENIG